MQGKAQNRGVPFPLALVCIVCIVLSAAFSNLSVVEALAVRWVKFDENLGHALPMLAVCLFFLISSLKGLSFRSGLPLLVIFTYPVLIATAWLMKQYDILVVQQLVVWLFIALNCVLLFRLNSSKKCFFAIGLLVFVIPVWDQLVPFLAELTTIVVRFALQLSGIVAFFEGRNIELPFGIITVADSCSGVRYVTIGFALSYLSAFTLPVTFAVRMKIVLIGILLSIFANWLRVYIIVLVGYYSEMQSELVADHELFGFVLFFIVIAPIALYKPKTRAQDDKWGILIFDWLERIFAKETKALPLTAKLAYVVGMSMTTASVLYVL